jgi:O-antigen/teichoic acid export membrane protein
MASYAKTSPQRRSAFDRGVVRCVCGGAHQRGEAAAAIMAGPVSEPVNEQPADILDTGLAGGMVMRGAVLRLAGFGAGGLLTAASAILLTRHLGVVRFGQYATIVALATLVAQLTEGGLTNLTTRDFALASSERKVKLIGDRLGLQLVTTFVAIALCGVFALAAGYGSARTWGALAAGLGLGLAMLQGTVAVPLVASLRLGATSGLELARQAILVGLTVVLVLVGAGLLPLLAALIPSSLIVLAATWGLARQEVRVRPIFHPRAWAALVRPAIVLSLSSGVATIYIFTAQILTSLSASSVQTGLFAASLRVFAVVASIPALMVTSALPLLARAARDDADRLEFAMQGLFEVALIAGVGVGVILIVGAKPIIDVVGGHKYAGATGPLRIEGAAVLGTCLTPVWSTGLLALHRHSAQLVCNLISLAVVAGVTLGLAPVIGARGAAVATVVGEWTVAVSLLLALRLTNRRLMPKTLAVAPRVAIAGASAVAVMLLPIPAIAQLALAILVYTVVVVALNALPVELLELAPGLSARFRRA